MLHATERAGIDSSSADSHVLAATARLRRDLIDFALVAGGWGHGEDEAQAALAQLKREMEWKRKKRGNSGDAGEGPERRHEGAAGARPVR